MAKKGQTFNSYSEEFKHNAFMRNDLELVLNTVENWTKKKDVAEAVLHSDQGFQYTSMLYSSRLEDYGIKGSHSRKENCLDNACVESFFSHLKTEKLYINNVSQKKN
ncbi:DDE-type integrase/transposase/recombinase [Cytobacillus firmus]|uniref:DDE-type integrase/transposase/recombinase n=1 Tax=Bacillus sp. 22-7 TaxID=2709707 RepID=UPI0013D65817|nr:DDE-type integrase/transposase/recombinase [Bacillus sp. 22-7]